ncbi:hypothetical protein TIFTF001_042875, partial [Ficus carica]
ANLPHLQPLIQEKEAVTYCSQSSDSTTSEDQVDTELFIGLPTTKKAGNRGKKSKGASQGFGQFWELFWPVFGELWWLIFKAKEAAKVGPIWQENPAAKGGAKGRSTKIRYATVSQQVELITGHSSFKRGWLYLLSESSLSYVYAVGKQPVSHG